MFTDQIQLTLNAGNGGNGTVAWRREKYVPKGGPAGGDGGKGASITIEADTHLFSLEHFRHLKRIQTKNGQAGGGNNKKGKNGADLTIKVPVGTLIKDAQTKEILYDFTKKEESFLICKGGKGGKGNTQFKTSTNRAPNQFTYGKEGEKKEIIFELKLIADVGLIGMPNAGKSTFLSKISQAKVKIAPYPFTTLRPNIGLVEFLDFSRIFVADIPGIIRDAHENKGLGLKFLKHIERTSVLLFVIDISAVDGRDPLEDFFLLKKELHAYNPKILEKPFLIILNKMDLETSEKNKSIFIKKNSSLSDKIFSISALNRQGFSPLLDKLQEITKEESFLPIIQE